MKNVRMALLPLCLALPLAAQAQFGGFNLNKLLDAGKKVIEANRDIGEQEEIELGDGISSMILGASPLHADKSLQSYVNRVGRWVASQSSRPDLPWAFGVIDAPTVNAFAMPGGKVFVSAGLVKRLNSEAELAGVLAHEIAHVTQKHQVQAIQAARRSGVLKDVGQAALSERIAKSNLGNNPLAATLATVAAAEGMEWVKNGVFLRPLDRALEYEADRVGVTLAARAGYDAYGLVAALQVLMSLAPADSGSSLLMSTHPAPAERLAELEKFASTFDKYAAQPQVPERFAAATAALK